VLDPFVKSRIVDTARILHKIGAWDDNNSPIAIMSHPDVNLDPKDHNLRFYVRGLAHLALLDNAD
jgi:hypothetical protein